MLALLLAAAQSAGAPAASEELFERHRDAVFTIEVHTGSGGSRSSLGSGYLVDTSGTLVTNHHVVASFIEDPERYRIRARARGREVDARLVAFDLVNDLALLHVEGTQDVVPLAIAPSGPARGASLTAFGDPHGLGLSVVEGLYNGPAEKGVVDRMRLSMPLNPGMSGGPILSREGRVVGTNVSIVRFSNSLSFGVPLAPLEVLLDGPRLESLDPDALLAETRRQLLELEERTARRLREGLDAREGETVAVGGAVAAAPPDFFDCWDDSDTDEASGLSTARRGCDLQFTPALDATGPVSAVEYRVQHLEVPDGGWGFYGYLASVVAGSHSVRASPPGPDAPRTAPDCVADRFRDDGRVWSGNTCVSAYRDYPGLYDLSLVAVTVDRAREAVVFDVELRGFRLETVLWLSRRLFAGLGGGEAG